MPHLCVIMVFCMSSGVCLPFAENPSHQYPLVYRLMSPSQGEERKNRSPVLSEVNKFQHLGLELWKSG